MWCKKIGKNSCMVILFLTIVMLFYAFSLYHIHTSIMGKSSVDLKNERLKKKQMQQN